MDNDAKLSELTDAIQQLQSGDMRTAKRRLEELWTEGQNSSDPLHQCILAHFLADAQENVADELAWDLLALDAASKVTSGRMLAFDAKLSLKDFYPSLYLNVADAYVRLGDLDNARRYLAMGHDTLAGFSEAGYGAMIRGGYDRLATRLDMAPAR